MKSQVPIGIFLTLLSLLCPQVSNPMHVIRTSLLLLLLCIVQLLHAQTTVSRVTFPIDDSQTINDLAKAGLDLSHGHGKLGSHFTTEALDFELKRFDQLGLRYTIEIADLSKHRIESSSQSRDGLLECQDDLNNAIVPKNFKHGSV